MKDMELLTSVNTSMQANMIESILKDNGIPCVKRHLEAGDYVEVFTGSSNFGANIYVSQEDLERAGELIAFLNTPIDDEDYFKEAEEHMENEPKVTQKGGTRVMIFFFIVIITLLALLLVSRIIQA